MKTMTMMFLITIATMFAMDGGMAWADGPAADATPATTPEPAADAAAPPPPTAESTPADDGDDMELGEPAFPDNSPEAKKATLTIGLHGGGGKYGDEAVAGGGVDLGLWAHVTQHFGVVPKFQADFLSSKDCQLTLALLLGGRMYGDQLRGGAGVGLSALVSMEGDKDPTQEIALPPEGAEGSINTTPKAEKVGAWRGTGLVFPMFLDIQLTPDVPVWLTMQVNPAVEFARDNDIIGVVVAFAGFTFSLF